MGAGARLRDLRRSSRPGCRASGSRRRSPATAPRPIAWATGLGAASSSCSYAAIAIAKSLFQKGASAASALAFQFASTNLVWELGLVLWVLLGWQFTLAEYVGGIVMIVLMAVLLRALRLAAAGGAGARATPRTPTPATSTTTASDERWAGARACSRRRAGPRSPHNFRGDWQMLWKEIAIGFLLAGFIGLLGDDFFNVLFLSDAPRLGGRDRERPRRPADRRAQLRLLGRQHPPRRGALVGRDQLRRRDGLHLRRPDRAADRARLPQVLRLDLHRCGSSP